MDLLLRRVKWAILIPCGDKKWWKMAETGAYFARRLPFFCLMACCLKSQRQSLLVKRCYGWCRLGFSESCEHWGSYGEEGKPLCSCFNTMERGALKRCRARMLRQHLSKWRVGRGGLNVVCFPGFSRRWQVWGHSAIEYRAENLEGVKVALSPMELRLPRVRPLKTKFNAIFFSFLHISAAEKLFFKKVGRGKSFLSALN